MKRGQKQLLILITVLMLFSAIVAYKWHRYGSQMLGDQPPYFDLFIAASFFGDQEGSPFDIVPEDQCRSVTWLLNVDQFEILDTVVITLRNSSGEKFYYTSWGAPLTRLRTDLIVYRDGGMDSIPFGGFGCFTGVYLSPLGKDASVCRTLYNPLMFDPWSNYELPVEVDSFPDLFRAIYGDSVGIRFSQATYGLPWNKFPSQMIFSERIIVSSEKILDHWNEGRYARLPDRQPTMEEHFGIKNFPQ